MQRRNYRFRQLPVRRNKSRCAFRRFKHLAHGKGDGPGFLGAGCAFDDRQAGQAVAAEMRACLAKTAPVGAERGRLESLAHQVTAQGPGTEIDSRRLPDRDPCRFRIQCFQKKRQLVLRMAGVMPDLLPVIGGGTVQPGKHHIPVRQPGDTGDKLARRGEGSGRPCHHDKLLWRITSPCLTTQPDQPVPPVSRVKDAFLFQDRRPAIYENGQQFQNVLPVAREPVGKQFNELFRRCVGIAERIEKPRQRFGKPDRLRRRERGVANPEAGKKPRQPHLAPHRIHGGRKRPAVGRHAQDVRRFLVDIANRVDSRQQART